MTLERLEHERKILSLYITGGDEQKQIMMSEWLDICLKIEEKKDEE